MKKVNKNLKIYFLVMFVLLIIAAIFLRMDHYIFKIIGIILFPFIIALGFIIITMDK